MTTDWRLDDDRLVQVEQLYRERQAAADQAWWEGCPTAYRKQEEADRLKKALQSGQLFEPRF